MTDLRLVTRFLTLTAVFLVWAAALSVQAEDCSSCGDPKFPEAAAFLAQQGYPVSEYAVLLTWQEAVPATPGELLTGYRVKSKVGGDPFDLYSDSTGKLLDDDTLNDLGVHPKNWNLGPIEQMTEFPEASQDLVSKQTVEEPVTPLAVAPSATIQLPALDMDAIRAQDDANEVVGVKSAKRIGVVRDLSEPIVVTAQDAGAATWTTSTGGVRVVSFTIASPGAYAMRIHFADLNIPGDATLLLYNANNPVEAYGPITQPNDGSLDLWPLSVYGESVTIQCSTTKGEESALRFTIDQVVHTYETFGDVQWSKAAGTCNLDVSCYSEWADTARGVAGFSYIASPNQLYCSGSLIADTDATTQIPYFLTANHCFNASTTRIPANMEIVWLYQTSTCGGTVPAITDVPRTTGGATLIATVSLTTGSDFLLIRLKNSPPADIPFLGWSTVEVGAGEEVTGIHHPQGSYKRISFGACEGNTHSSAPRERFIPVTWADGTTEGGSSGSPLFRASDQLIVGQLYGGLAGCTNLTGTDYYGRFDQTFPIVSEYLAPEGTAEDIDKSGVVNSADIQLVVNAALGIDIDPYFADVDFSGTIDAVDIQKVVVAVLNAG